MDLEKIYENVLNEVTLLKMADTKEEVAVCYHKVINAVCELLEKKLEQTERKDEDEEIHSN